MMIMMQGDLTGGVRVGPSGQPDRGEDGTRGDTQAETVRQVGGGNT